MKRGGVQSATEGFAGGGSVTEAWRIDSDSLEHLEVLISSVVLAFAVLSHLK